MKQGAIKIIILIAVIMFFVIVVKYYHLNDYIGLATFNNYRNQILGFKLHHPYEFIIGYILSYIILIILCIPGTILFDLIAGFVFGWFFGLFLVLLSYGTGAFLNFLLVRYFFKGLFAERFGRFKSLIHGSGRYGLLINLTGLRLIAVIPFWILNIVAALLNVKPSVFLISTLIGIIPSTIIYVIIGDGVRDALNSGKALTPELLVNPKIWLPIFIMALLLMLPNIMKYVKQTKLQKIMNTQSSDN